MENAWFRFGPGHEHLAFSVWPARAPAPLPAVVVLPEVWGLDDHIESVCHRFAGAGHLAVAPDLHLQGGCRPACLVRERITEARGFLDGLPAAIRMDIPARERELARLPSGERDRIGETLGALFAYVTPERLAALMPLLFATTTHLRERHPLSRGAGVAAVGFCMGGSLAARLACRDPGLAGAVSFY